MFNKFCVVIIQIFLINGQTLPIKNHPTTSYYQQNAFGPNSYAFGFEVKDNATGNIQFRDERRYGNGTTYGSYGYVQPDGSVRVTHYLADGQLGYLSQSRNFEPGENPIWKTNWPTKKPNISTQSPDDENKVNLSSILLPVEPIKVDHGIDLNPAALEKQLINPAILEVVNGEAPLKNDIKKKSGSIRLETVNKFIPPEFPIVPFELPADDFKIKLNEGLSENLIPVLNKTNSNETSIENSVNKTLPKQSSTKNEWNKSPEVESIITKKSSDWYDKIINQTRQKYLEIVH